MNHKPLLCTLASLLMGTIPGWSQVPQLVNFMGRVAVDGVNFDGTGQFKVAIVDPDAPQTYWSNDGTSVNGGEPTDAVKIAVNNGHYSILLGDATLDHMTVLPASAFAHNNLWVRVWFSDGVSGFQQLTPDQRIAAVGYAMIAAGVPGGAIDSAQLANGAVTSSKIASNAVNNSKLADNSVGPNQIGAGAVGSSEIAPNAVGTSELNLSQVDSRYVEVTGDLMSNAVTAPILRVENTATSNSQSKAIVGRTSSSTSNAAAIHGILDADPAGGLSAAVRGENNGTTNGGIGIYGTHAGSGWGVYGNATGATGSGSRGVYGRSSSDSGRGVYGLAASTTGTTYGVRGFASSPDGYGGYFSGGGVGLLASSGDNSGADIVLGGNDDGRIFSNPAYTSSDIWLHSNDGIVMYLDHDNSGEDHDFEVKRGDQTNQANIFNIDDSGWTQWWRTDGTQLLELHPNGTVEFFGPTGTEYAQLREDTIEGGGELQLRFPDGSIAVLLEAKEVAGDGASLNLYNDAGDVALALDAEYNDGGPSRVTTGTVQITGGSDLSEQFEIQPSEAISQPEPGMIVCIDPDHPGQLVPSSLAYDRTVAGIISGAGGVHPGMLMGQVGTLADGEHPVALTGRVYCQVTAANGPIEPGDMITTSDLPGHGMKVTDHDRARGAIIGKAMTRLEEGSGLVLVLVSLQ